MLLTNESHATYINAATVLFYIIENIETCLVALSLSLELLEHKVELPGPVATCVTPDFGSYSGSSVLDAILTEGTFTPRALTRKPDSDASKALKDRGVEVVKADLSDKTSLVKALEGCEAIFGVRRCTIILWIHGF